MATYYWRGGTGTWTNASTANWAAATTAATFTASRATTVLTVTAVASGTITNGDTVWHTNGTSIGTITSFGTGLGGTGTYNMSASGTVTSRTMSSATIGAGPTASTDDAIIDADSNVGTATATITSAGGVCRDFTASGLDAAITLATSTGPTFHGSVSFPASNFSMTSNGPVTFAATSSKTITTNGVSFSAAVTFNGAAGTWQLQDNFTSALTVTLTTGTIDLNGKTLTGLIFSSNNSNTRGITAGGGKVVLTGNGATILSANTVTNYTATGALTFECNYSGATGTRTLSWGATAGESESNAPNIKVTAGTDTVGIVTSSAFLDLDFTGFAGSFSNTVSHKLYGGLTLNSSMTFVGGANVLTFAATSGTKLLTSGSSAALNQPVTLNGAGGTLKIVGDLSISTTRALTLTNGTLDLNGYNFTCGLFATAAGAKAITWNGGKITVLDAGATAFNNAAPTNFSTSAGSGAGTIDMTSGSAKTFVGGGSSFAAKLNQGGAGTLTITGSNTFSDISNTLQPATISFTAATTTTFTAGFSLSGTSGNQITIGSVTAANHNLSMAAGVVNVSYCDISRSQAAGGATWNSYTTNGNVDNGNNSGWIFSVPVAVYPKITFL